MSPVIGRVHVVRGAAPGGSAQVRGGRGDCSDVARATPSAQTHAKPLWTDLIRAGRRRYALLLGALLLIAGPTPAAGADFNHGPTLAPVTHPRLFVSSFRALAPTLPVTDGVDIATLRTGAPVARPLQEQLQLLFEAFLSATPNGSTEAVQVQVSYSYGLAPGSALRMQVPVLRLPASTFVVPGDWSPGIACQVPQDPALVCSLATSIHRWLGQQAAAIREAQLTFDLTGLPDASSGFGRPNLQAKGLTLSLADITNP